MRKLIIILSFISINIFGVTFPEKSKEIKDFVPKNWKIFENVNGDLNKDGIEDVVLIIEDTNPDNMKKNEILGPNLLNLNPRILILLFKNKNDEYVLAGKNDDGFIESESNEDSPALMDPLEDKSIYIQNGTLKITFFYFMSAGSWSASNVTYTFRYQENRFQLIGLDYNTFMRNSGQATEYSLNLSTQKLKKTENINMFDEKESKPKVTWKNIKINKKYYLENMGKNDIHKIFE